MMEGNYQVKNQKNLLEKLCLRKFYFIKKIVKIAVYSSPKSSRSGVCIEWTNLETTLLPVVPRNDTYGAVYRRRVTKSQTFITKIFSHRVWRAHGTYVQRLNLPNTVETGIRPSAASHSSRKNRCTRPLDTRITSISLAYVCCSTNDIYSAARSPGVNPTNITFLLNVNRPDVRVPGLSNVARFPRTINSTAETRNIDDGFNSGGT